MAYANVRFCIDGVKKVVPAAWFKDSKFKPSNYDSKKAYLVFYSPGDLQTPEAMLKRMSKIPVFESASDLDKFAGTDASGFYRATVSQAADSLDALMALITKTRSKDVPLFLVKETSFEKSAREKRGNSSKDSLKRGSSSSSTKAHSQKKGKIEPVAEKRQRASSSNVNILKRKLIKMQDSKGDDGHLEEPSNLIKCSESSSDQYFSDGLHHKLSGMNRKHDGDVAMSASMSQDPSSSQHCDSSPDLVNLPLAGKIKQKVSQCQSDSGMKMNTSEKTSKWRWPSQKAHETTNIAEKHIEETPACRSFKGKEASDTSSLKPKSQSTHSPLAKNQHKISESDGSGSDSSDDCFVSAEKHLKLKEILKQKEAQLFQLQKINEKLRKSNDSDENSNTVDLLEKDAFEPNQNFSANDKDSSGGENLDSQPSSPACAQTQSTKLVVLSEEEIFKREKVVVTKENLADLKKIGAGATQDKPYVKLAAQLMWGSKYLREHSTNGQRDPKNKNAAARPAIDTVKLAAVRDMLIYRVTAEEGKYAGDGKRCKESRVKRIIGEKIQSLINSEYRQEAKRQQQQQQ